VYQKDQDQRGESRLPKAEKLGGDKSKRTRKGNEIRSAGEDFALWLKHESACQFKYESERRPLKEGFCDGEDEI